ncbi:transposase [Thermodesulfovibrionales bacterium]|nr:transposase [Thermodesulfovibrionales bacterium]
MKDVNTKKLKRVNGKTLLVTVDASKMKHSGYCRCPDGTDIKPFEFFNTGRGFQEFWEKICHMKTTHGLEDMVVGFESTGPYAEPLLHFLRKRKARLVRVNPLHTKRLKELQEIQILDKENRLYSGELLSHNLQEIVLRRKNGTIVAIKRGNTSSIEFPAFPDALVTSPTLVWEIISEKAGQHKVEATYLTGGLNWKANYLAIIAPEGNFLNLNSWVTVNNTSGVAYSDATLKLIAGEVRRVKERPQVRMKTMMLDVAVPMATEFKHQPLFEYHIYTLPRRITLKDDQEKQILFLTSQNIPFRKVYTFETGTGHWRWDRRVGPLKAPVKVTIEFKNDKESGIGMPLPAGRVKVYKDSEGGLEFIGEDSIPHTPKSEEVKLHIGNAFDIIGKKKHTEHKEITRHIFENTYEISLRNHKQEMVTIQVIERLTGDWEIIQADHKYEKKDAFTLKFVVDIPAGSFRSITYTVRHR